MRAQQPEEFLPGTCGVPNGEYGEHS
jgi:hypothetical protein